MTEMSVGKDFRSIGLTIDCVSSPCYAFHRDEDRRGGFVCKQLGSQKGFVAAEFWCTKHIRY